jgi:hypothetical protein
MSEIEVCLDEAEHGACDALYNLGMMYSTGRGVSVDFVEAHKWFNLAAVKGNSDAQTWRKELAQEMTTTQIAEAQRQARAWLSTH